MQHVPKRQRRYSVIDHFIYAGGPFMTTQEQEPVFACNPQAIPDERRPAHQAHTERAFAAVQEVRELPTGYALRLPNERKLLQTIMAFICDERLCCPFFRFGLEIEPEQGPVWLQLTGASHVKPFLWSEGFVPPNQL
jgi:hypothetical protein